MGKVVTTKEKRKRNIERKEIIHIKAGDFPLHVYIRAVRDR